MQTKSSFLRFIILAFATFISGCSTPDPLTPARAKEWANLANTGRCDEAESIIRQDVAPADPGRAAYGMFLTAVYCRVDKQLAIRYLTLSARYGFQEAQDKLVRIGQPVPAADLKPKEDDITPLLIGIAAGVMSNHSPPVVNYAPPQGNSIPPMPPKGSGNHGGTGMTMCPDGTFVAGSGCVMTPNGTYVGHP